MSLCQYWRCSQICLKVVSVGLTSWQTFQLHSLQIFSVNSLLLVFTRPTRTSGDLRVVCYKIIVTFLLLPVLMPYKLWYWSCELRITITITILILCLYLYLSYLRLWAAICICWSLFWSRAARLALCVFSWAHFCIYWQSCSRTPLIKKTIWTGLCDDHNFWLWHIDLVAHCSYFKIDTIFLINSAGDMLNVSVTNWFHFYFFLCGIIVFLYKCMYQNLYLYVYLSHLSVCLTSYWSLPAARGPKTPRARKHCSPESFCASGKFLRVYTKWAQNQVKT